MKTCHFSLIISSLIGLLGLLVPASMLAQRNIYVVNDSTPQTVSIIPAVERVAFTEGGMTFSRGERQTVLALGSVREMGLREPTNETNVNVPPSFAADLDFDVRFSSADTLLASRAEASPTDSSDAFFLDFEANSAWAHRVLIHYDGATATVSGGEGLSEAALSVSVSGGHVVVRADASGIEYVLSGASADGSFKIYSEKRYKVTLAGVDLTNPTGPALNAQSGKRMYLVLADGTKNALTDGANYRKVSGEDAKGCVFSEGQICISGSGQLRVAGHRKAGIASDEYVHVISGFVRIDTDGRKGAGIKTKEAFVMGGGALHILAEGAAAKGISSDSIIALADAAVTVVTTGNAIWDDDEQDFSSACGIKAARNITIARSDIGLLATGRGGKGMSAGSQTERTVTVVAADGTTQERIEVVKHSGEIQTSVASGQGVLSIADSRILCKTSGDRARRVVTFDNATSSRFFFSGEDASSTTPITLNINSSSKAIKAIKKLSISGSEILVRSTGGDGGEGLESKEDLDIAGSKVRSVCFDDGVNAQILSIDETSDVLVFSYDNDGIDAQLKKCAGRVYSVGGKGDQLGIDTDGKMFVVPAGSRVVALSGGLKSRPNTEQNYVYANFYEAPAFVALVDSATAKPILAIHGLPDYGSYNLYLSIPELEIGKTYQFVSFETLESGTEESGVISDAVFSDGKVVYTFTPTQRSTFLDGSSSGGGTTSGGGSSSDSGSTSGGSTSGGGTSSGGTADPTPATDLTVPANTPFRIVSSALGRGGISISADAVSYDLSDTGENIWWYVDIEDGRWRFRNTATGQCLTCTAKEYSAPILTDAAAANSLSYWGVRTKDDYFQFCRALDSTTSWYLKVSTKNYAVTVDRYTGNSTFYLVDESGKTYQP